MLEGDVDLSLLRARLVDVSRPDSVIIWLYQPYTKDLLRGLAAGTIPLTHAALDDVVPRAAADYHRGLLVAVGLLPARDQCLARFDRWVDENLAEFATGADFNILSQFATWGLRRPLAARSESSPLRDAQVANATQKLRVGASLLGWLHERGHDLAAATQADIDAWFATPPSTHGLAATFLRWAMSAHRCPKLVIPRPSVGTRRVLGQAERLNILSRLLDPAIGRLEHRVAGMLLVLFGQPFNRIAALTLDDVVIDNVEISLRLGQGNSPVPPPFAAMVRDLAVARPNLNTATNPTSNWLFPGYSTNSHLTPHILRVRAIEMGIDLMGARSGALRQLVLDCPPPVVADLLGYSYQTIDRHAIKAGSPWSSYAALRADRPDRRQVP